MVACIYYEEFRLAIALARLFLLLVDEIPADQNDLTRIGVKR